MGFVVGSCLIKEDALHAKLRLVFVKVPAMEGIAVAELLFCAIPAFLVLLGKVAAEDEIYLVAPAKAAGGFFRVKKQ